MSRAAQVLFQTSISSASNCRETEEQWAAGGTADHTHTLLSDSASNNKITISPFIQKNKAVFSASALDSYNSLFFKPLYLAVNSAIIYGHDTKKAAIITFLPLLNSQYEHLHSFLSKPKILDTHLDYISFILCTLTSYLPQTLLTSFRPTLNIKSSVLNFILILIHVT